MDTLTSASAKTPNEIPSLRLIGLPPLDRLTGWLFRKPSVHEFFDKRLTLEFHQLNIGFHSPIERKTDRPWAREHAGILDRCLVRDVERADERKPLGHVGRVTQEVAGAIQPVLVVQ